MKQLAATALLWALKDACGKQLPVIIDTPLGRIDKQHQDNLLNRYYPKAARQVILLPTDSELDERKRQLLAPYIYREYQLHNDDGNKTRIELMPSYQEVRNGWIFTPVRTMKTPSNKLKPMALKRPKPLNTVCCVWHWQSLCQSTHRRMTNSIRLSAKVLNIPWRK